jgi:hypothetical protein
MLLCAIAVAVTPVNIAPHLVDVAPFTIPLILSLAICDTSSLNIFKPYKKMEIAPKRKKRFSTNKVITLTLIVYDLFFSFITYNKKFLITSYKTIG